jgi:hypothetical protein
VNVIATEGGKDRFAIKVCTEIFITKRFLAQTKISLLSQSIAKIHRAQVMAAAFLVSASVRLVGKERIAVHETNRFINVYPAVLTTAIMIWKPARVFATNTGRVMIVHRRFAVSIADQMESVSRHDAAVTLAGLELCANN